MSESPPRAEQLLRQLEWRSLRRLDGLLQGDYRTLLRGNGLDLADLREYQYGDDVRRIDWNATARLDQPQVRDDLEERELTAWFVVDLSASVRFGSGGASKRDRAIEACGLLARLLIRRGNRVGAIAGEVGAQRVLPAGTGRRHVLTLLEHLARAGDATPITPAESGKLTDLAGLLRAAQGVARRRALIVVVSDFISVPGWDDALARLAMRHDMLALRVIDPFERELPEIGLVPMRDAETGERLLVDTSDPALRARHAALAAAAEESLREAFARAGVDAVEIACDEDPVDALADYLRLRQLHARLRSGAAVPAGGTHALPVA